MKRRAWFVAALATLGLSAGFVAVLAPATPAWACDCVSPDYDGDGDGEPDVDELADLIVLGTVTEVTDLSVELVVESVEKGSFEAGGTLRLEAPAEPCGYPFTPGDRYRVPSRAGATYACMGIRELASRPATSPSVSSPSVSSPVVAAARAAATSPAPGSASRSWQPGPRPLAVGASLAVVVLGVGSLALRRRRARAGE